MNHNRITLSQELLTALEKGVFPRRAQNPSEFIEQWSTRKPEDSRLILKEPNDGTRRTLARYIHDQIRVVDGVYPSSFVEPRGKEEAGVFRRIMRGFAQYETKAIGRRVEFNYSIYDQVNDKLSSRVTIK